MEEKVTRKVRHKNDDGTVTEARLGALAEDVLESDTRMFVTKKEKEALEEMVNTIKVIPSVSENLIYTGGQQSPQWRDFDPAQLDISGQTSGINAGTYTAVFTPKSGRKWADGTTTPKDVAWNIGRAEVAIPVQKGNLIYTGVSQNPVWTGYDVGKMFLSGETTGLNAGSYAATFTPTSNYQWPDGSVTAKTVSWMIGRSTVSTVPVQSDSLTYTGSEQHPAWNGYDEKKYSISGQTSGTNAGTYTAIFTPTSNYQWSEGDINGRNAQWSIGRATIPKVPSQNGVLSYTGSVQTPKWNDYNQNQLTIGGIWTAIEEGSYTATFTPTANYQWADGSITARNVVWKISGKVISNIPSPKSNLTYNGSSQAMTWNDYDSSQLIIGGIQSATDAGTYTATFTPQKGYVWSDGTRNAREVQWTIQKMEVSVPSQRGTLTYNGNTQYPSWDNYNMSQLTISGNQSGIDAGTYEAVFAPKSNYKFADGAEAEIVPWRINKAPGRISCEPDRLTFSKINETKHLTVAISANGLRYSVIDNKVAYQGDYSKDPAGRYIVPIKSRNRGNTTLVLNANEDTNYTQATMEIPITVNVADPILGNNTPEKIQEVARSGQAANIWSVGDTVPIHIDFTMNTTSINGTYYAVIIGVDHNSSVEGSNTIHFQIGKDASGNDIAFVDSQYAGNAFDAAEFYMHDDTTLGYMGWKDCHIRKTICPAFFTAFPLEWQKVITDCTKYSDNVGGKHDDVASITSTQDKIWLLSEFEIFGKCIYSNNAEQNYQKQYDYYKNGNSQKRYKHNSSNETACNWWTRSVYYGARHFCSVRTDGSATSSSRMQTCGIAPAFIIA